MAREFDLDKYEESEPVTLFLIDKLISSHDCQRLYALNQVREGNVVEALDRLDIEALDRLDIKAKLDLYRFPMAGLGDKDTKEWRKDMLSIRDYLREQGL